MPTTPVPRQPAPPLSVPLVGRGTWTLSEQSPERFTLMVFYRGLHCPVCKDYLQTLTEIADDYGELGVEAFAVSMDSEVRARKSRIDWKLDGFSLGHSLSEDAARAWGLYLSESIKDAEPDLFSEPGLFLVRPDGTLYYAAVNSAPWGRPHLPSFLKGVRYIIENDYPARGEVVATT